jgi:hypothetical protein
VHAGSKIYTNFWRGYNFLNNSSIYNHATVNHSQCFKDPMMGVHTNMIEGTNFVIKRMIPIRNRTKEKLGDHLFEFIWRYKHANSDIWMAFISAMQDIHYNLE